MNAADRSLLAVRNLSVQFERAGAPARAVTNVSFELKRGEVLCLLGESGCGKTVTLRAITKLLPRRTKVSGEILLDGDNLLTMTRRRLNAVRGGRIAMIFQDALLAFDPIYSIGDQMVETIRCHAALKAAAARTRALKLLDMVHIPSSERCFASYPHELSGGTCQRALIALALSCQPDLLLADEPTTALDATVQIQILILLREIQRQSGMSMIFVTHDIGVAAEIADRVAIMYAGRIIETGTAGEVLSAPKHPYTQGLLASASSGLKRGEQLQAIPGSPPNLSALPAGCSFWPRCRHAMPACQEIIPEETYLAAHRTVCCHLLHAQRITNLSEIMFRRSVSGS